MDEGSIRTSLTSTPHYSKSRFRSLIYEVTTLEEEEAGKARAGFLRRSLTALSHISNPSVGYDTMADWVLGSLLLPPDRSFQSFQRYRTLFITVTTTRMNA